MKIKILILCAALLTLTLLGNAQDRALKFLGIPVDGYKSGMIQKLRNKGYTYKNWSEQITTKSGVSTLLMTIFGMSIR